MNYYFSYAIRCIIRRIIYFLTKPKYLLIIVTSIIVIFLLSNYTSVFGWEGNNDYTDKNNTIALNYESIVSDFIIRLSNLSKNNVNYNNLMTMLNNDEMSFYLYYGDSNGSSMTGANYFVTSNLNIIFYLKSNPVPGISTQERYNGMYTTMYNITTSIQDYYYFQNGILYTSNKPSSVVIPGVLISYVSPAWVNYYNNDSQQQTNDIVGAINEQTNSINEQTNTIQEQTTVIQETQDFISDDSIDNNSMSVDTTGMTVTDSNNIFGFLTGFLNNLKNFFNNISDDVQIIEIPMPHNMDSIYLRSDVVSSHIEGTFLYTFIQTLWYFVFGTYLLFYIKHLINFFSTGEFAYTGLAQFIEHLENEDVIIRSTMM